MTIIVTLIILFIIQYVTEKREVEKDYDRFVQQAKSKPKEEKAVGDDFNDNNSICLDDRTTTGLVLNTLGSIGCDPEIEEHDNLNWISFTYQGEHFKI